MGRTICDEAIILRTYNVGEADRFCILLTRSLGRVAARAHGVRRLLSRRGAGLLALHTVEVTLNERQSGYVITGVATRASGRVLSENLRSFSEAQQVIELILHFVADEGPVESVFLLTCEFLEAVRRPHSPQLLPTFTLKLLAVLGLLPSLSHSSMSGEALLPTEKVMLSAKTGGLCRHEEDREGIPLSAELYAYLSEVPAAHLADVRSLPPLLLGELRTITQRLLGSQLDSALKVPPVAARISSGATPIW